jgi:hypothetical protein
LEENAYIHGEVKAKSMEMMKSAVIEGTICAPDGMVFTTPESKEIKTKIDRFERGLDDFEAVLD